MIPIPRPDELLYAVLNRHGGVTISTKHFDDYEKIIPKGTVAITNTTLLLFDYANLSAISYAEDEILLGHVVLYKCCDIVAVKIFTGEKQIIGVECKSCEVTRFGMAAFQAVVAHRFGYLGQKPR